MRVRILNVEIDNITFERFLAELDQGVVFTPNVDHLIKLQHDHEFYRAYAAADYRVCDSRIIQLVSPLVSATPIVEQITGSDFFPAFCQHHRHNTDKIRVFLLGGSEQTVQLAAKRINQRAAAQVVVGAYSPPFGFEKDAEQTAKIIELVNRSSATVVALGVGAPKQEKWIIAHRHRMPNVRIFFAIGATIEFIGGGQRRAPKMLSRLGLEWAYRLAQEPRRMVRRYLIEDLPFFQLLLEQRLGRYRDPFA